MRIFEFAFVADWESRLQTLANMAERERWTYVSVPTETSSLPILDSYIRFTFIRLYDQRKVIETDNLACFNTGLLTPTQSEIFGVFTISDRYDPSKPEGPNNYKWFLSKWVDTADRTLTGFRELPKLASYWSDPSELILNPSLEFSINLDHVISDRANRFPIELGGALDENGVPTDLNKIPDIEDELDDTEEETTKEVRYAIQPNTRNALEGAIQHSIRLAKRSYRIAVPQFYQKKIQLLLPLYLRDNPKKPDLALTLENHGEWYRAATILYPDWAYRHARLLARPNSEWLGGFKEDDIAPN